MCFYCIDLISNNLCLTKNYLNLLYYYCTLPTNTSKNFLKFCFTFYIGYLKIGATGNIFFSIFFFINLSRLSHI